MKPTTLALSVALLDLTQAYSDLLIPRNGAPRVVQLETRRKEIRTPPHIRDQLRKRANTLNVDLTNEQTLYFINISLGTPAQSLHLDIDTGSSDLWTNVETSDICSEHNGDFCAASGTYSANDSSTYNYVNSDFYIKYADGSTAVGDYATDTLRIGSTSVTDMQFGIGYNSSSQNGILGVGYETNEVQRSFTGESYRNLPAMLVEKNVINTNAYSLWLNDQDANTGTILFGGVDMDKFSGSLSTLPIVKEDNEYREFIIVLTAVEANGKSIFSDQEVPVLLDSGSSLSYLPDDYVQSIYDQFNADYQSDAGAAIVDCSLMNSDATIDFTFSSPKISVPMNELVVIGAVRGNGDPICILGISPTGGSTPVLGDTFLRSAYVVYDLENNQISLAATKFNATSSNVQEISSTVPGATTVSGAKSTASVGSGGGRIGSVSGLSAAAGQHSMLANAAITAICAGLMFFGAGLILL